jgi:hypothetical protein
VFGFAGIIVFFFALVSIGAEVALFSQKILMNRCKQMLKVEFFQTLSKPKSFWRLLVANNL